MKGLGRTAVAGWLALAVLCAASAGADTCTVPSTPYPTIQAAVDDLVCTEVVLAAQTFVGSATIDRDLTLRGASSTSTVVEGRLVVEGSSTEVVVEDLRVDGSAPSVAGCFPVALVVRGGARVTSNDVVVLNGGGEACVIFRDGFESGDTGSWTTNVP